MKPVGRVPGDQPPDGAVAQSRLPRVDLAVLGPWIVDLAYVDPPRHSPEHSWFVSTAAEYGVAPDVVQVVMRELSYGWSVRTALIRASVPPSQWNSVIAFLQRLVHASVMDRSGLGAPVRGR